MKTIESILSWFEIRVLVGQCTFKIQGYFEFVVFLFVFIAKLEEEKKKLLTADTRVRRGEDYVLPIGYSWINPSSQLFLLCYR